MGLSKAFDCIRHGVLTAKLHACGFSHDTLLLLQSYLENRHQRVKINGTYSNCKSIKLRVPQGSFLGPLFFSIYVNALFCRFIKRINVTMPTIQPYMRAYRQNNL